MRPAALPTPATRRRLERLNDHDWIKEHDPVTLLPAVRGLRSALHDYEDELVAAARRQGASWQRIADALGCARQTAMERFAHVEEGRR
jgi:hypothetical protein